MSLFDKFKSKKAHDKPTPDTKSNDKVQFVKLIGAADAELKALYNKEITVKEIAEKIGSDLTDYTRSSVL